MRRALALALIACLAAPATARADADAPTTSEGPPAAPHPHPSPRPHPIKPTTPTRPAPPKAQAKTPAPAAPPPPAAAPPLEPAELEAVVRSALETATVKLPRGANLTRVRALAPVIVPPATTRTTLELTPPPRRPGNSTATAVLVFWRGDTLAARAPVTLELTAGKDAAPEVAKGTPIVLLVRRDRFEISVAALTAEAGDVGEVVSVLLRPSGRSLRAQLTSRERAVAVEDPR